MAELYRTLGPAIVIVRAGTRRTTKSAGTTSTTRTTDVGAGVLLARDRRHVLTACHAVDATLAKGVESDVVVLLGAFSAAERSILQISERSAKVLRCDSVLDLALLELDSPVVDGPALELAPSDPSPGEEVVVLGHPDPGMQWSIKGCRVSAVGRLRQQHSHLPHFRSKLDADKFTKQFEPREVIQVSCRMLPGFSGGPVLDRRGRLLGIGAFSLVKKKGHRRTSYYIHLRELRRFLGSPAEQLSP